MASSDFFSDLSGGLEEGLGIAGKLQNISQSRQNFEMRKHSIEQQQAQIDDSLGLQEDVGNMLAAGKFDAVSLYKKHPRAYREIQELQAQQQHLTKAKAAGGGGLRISQQEIATLSKGLGSLDIGQSNKQLSGNIKSLLTRFKVPVSYTHLTLPTICSV